MRKHWSETFSCSCGKTFRSYSAEAYHRHNFPLFCKKKKVANSVQPAIVQPTKDDDVIEGYEWT